MSGKRNSEEEAVKEGLIKRSKLDTEIIVQSMNTWEIPNEIWLKIFQHLSMQDILLNVAGVCQHFLELSQDSELFQQVTITKIPESVQKFKMLDAIRSFKYLKYFEILYDLNEYNNFGKRSKFAEEITHLVWMALKNCPRLKQLNIKKFVGNFVESDLNHTHVMINNISEYGQNLQSLCLDFQNDLGSFSLSPLSKLKNLHSFELYLHKNYAYNSSDMVELAENCQNLKNLKLRCDGIPERSVISFLNKSKNTLEHLSLRTEGLGNEWFKHLLKCQEMKTFHFYGANIRNHLNGIKAISKLKKLRGFGLIFWQELPTTHFHTVFSNQNFGHLEYLKLSMFILQSFHDYFNAIYFPRLKKLYIGTRSRWEDFDKEIIGKVFRRFPQLIKLEMEWCNVDRSMLSCTKAEVAEELIENCNLKLVPYVKLKINDRKYGGFKIIVTMDRNRALRPSKPF